MKEFIYPLRIYIDDTDYTGVVYHANYLKFFERARSEWAEMLGFGVKWQLEQNRYFLVRQANIEYLKPALLHQRVEVVTRIAEFKRASYSYEQYLRVKDRIGTPLCKATVKIACVDLNYKPCALPKQFIEIMNGE